MEDNKFEHRVKIMCLFAHVIFIFLRLQVAVMYKNYFESQFTLIFPVVSDLLIDGIDNIFYYQSTTYLHGYKSLAYWIDK